MTSISLPEKESFTGAQLPEQSQLRSFIRLIGFGFIATTYFIITLPLFPFFLIFPFTIRKIYNYVLSFYAKILIRLMGIKVKATNLQATKHRGKLLVGNHMSYIDVLYTAAYNPGCFVTSVEMKKTPFLGQICILAGCVFVERRNKKNLRHEIKEITDSLANGLDVYIFPEATSTNGDEVIRFRRPLFNAAIDAGVDVLPFTINYEKFNDQQITQKNRDLICWYGDMTFFDHIWNLFSIKKIEISLNFHQKIPVNESTDALDLANDSHHIVSQNYHPFQ